MNQEIIKGTGGTLAYDVQQGRPASASATIHKPDGIQIATPSVTIDTATTTLDDSYAAGVLQIGVDSGTGINVRRRYLLTNSSGQSEWVRCRAINGTTVDLFEELAYAHTTASTLVGTRITCPVSAANADTLDEGYEVRWSYTVDSVDYVTVDQYDVVRIKWPEPVMAQWEFTRLLGQLAADINEAIAYSGEDFRDSVEVATEDLKTDILARGFHHNRFRSHNEFKSAIAWRVVLNWADRGENVPSIWQAEGADRWIDHVRERYNERLTTALNTARSFDADESGVVDESERVKRWGVIRITR